MRLIVAFVALFILILPTNLLSKESLLIFSGDLRGEIKPCGCAEEGDMGGLPRRFTFFKNQDSIYENLYYFDLGNNFPKPSEQGNLKISLIQTSLKKLNPRAMLVGPNEWANGLNRLDPQLPYLLSNQSEKLKFLEYKSINSKIKNITIFGYLSPNLVYQNKNDHPLIFEVNKKLIRDWRKKLGPKQESLKILLFRGNKKELQKFDEASMFDLIVAGSNNDDELNQILKLKLDAGDVPMIPTKGQAVLSVKINNNGIIVPDTNNTVPFGLSVTWLKRSFEDAKELNEIFKDYNVAVKELFISNLDRMEKQKNESPYVGDVVCSGCHQNSAKIWKNSRHFNAFKTLEEKNKHFDPECLECHVVGLKPFEITQEKTKKFNKFKGAKGFLSPQSTPHLKNVQCENCHGPSRAHLANSKIHPPIKDPKSTCIICHHGSHSPMFDFKSYWEKIKH